MSGDTFEPLVWAAHGISREEGERWFERNFDVSEAVQWRNAGVKNPAEARSWRIAGVGPGEVGRWQRAGIGFAAAATWREFGYSLEEARKLKAEGKSPGEAFRARVQTVRPSGRLRRFSGVVSGGVMLASGRPPQDTQHFIEKLRRRHPNLIHGYFQQQWLDDEALAWGSAGIDAADALVWKEFGIAPPEAARLAKAGQTAAATMRAWWEAGIPPGEVAAWLGAGLTPEEAAAHRAKGVTAERAAVLRALRDLDDNAD